MTNIRYKCSQHGLQNVEEIILPGNTCILSCGCIYGANYHGSHYRIRTSYCDTCGLVIEDTCLMISNCSTKFYHIDCAKDLGVIEKGVVINIDEYPDFEIEGLNSLLKKNKTKR